MDQAGIFEGRAGRYILQPSGYRAFGPDLVAELCRPMSLTLLCRLSVRIMTPTPASNAAATSVSRQETYDAACAHLEALEKELALKRKVLRRDWEQLSSRERSAYAREVKQMETQQAELEQCIKVNLPQE